MDSAALTPRTRTKACLLLWAAALCLPLCGCSPEHDPKLRAEKLIADLGSDEETATRASRELAGMNAMALAPLLQEVDHAADDDRSDEEYLRAARSLRIVRQMGNSSGLRVAKKVLNNIKPDPNHHELPSRVLLSEAVYYLMDHSEFPDARDALLEFIAHHERWRGQAAYLQAYSSVNDGELSEEYTRYKALGWNLARDIEDDKPHRLWVQFDRIDDAHGLLVDVYPVLQTLVDRKDPKVGKVLVELLKSEPYCYALNYEYLAEDGYHPRILVDSAGSLKALQQREPPAPNAQPRVLIMRWMRELNTTEGLEEVKKLIRSEHQAERDTALEVAEALQP